MDRRSFMISSLASAGLLMASSGASSGYAKGTGLTVPGFVNGPRPKITPKYGFRPWRPTYRLEAEKAPIAGAGLVVHSYGYGGGGVTLSWGAAWKVLDLIKDNTPVPLSQKPAVAVIGSGVIGMTTACLISSRLELPVTIYSDKPWKATVSNIAGGQWSPTAVDGTDLADIAVDALDYTNYLSTLDDWGVHRRDNYARMAELGLDKLHRLHVHTSKKASRIDARYVDRGYLAPGKAVPWPFAHSGPVTDCKLYRTYLVDVPVFLERLEKELNALNVRFVTQTFGSPEELGALGCPIIVNATGLGARKLFGDTSLQGIKGNLAVLDPEGEFDWLYSGIGYVFPRSRDIVVGGTFMHENTSLAPGNVCNSNADAPDVASDAEMLKVIRLAFSGMRKQDIMAHLSSLSLPCSYSGLT